MEPPGSTAAAEKVILRWDSTASEVDARDKMIFSSGDRLEIDGYLQAVDELQKCMSAAALSDSSSATSSTLQIAMARLEDEFRNILLSHTSPIETESTHTEKQLEHQESSTTSSIREIDLIPCDAVDDLCSIAKRMIAAGCLRKCIHVYASVRNSAVDASLKKNNVEKLSIGDIHEIRPEWKFTLETMIRRWIRAAKICIRVLFASERRLCEQIFRGLGNSADDECFMETIKGPAIQLFNFAEAVSITTRSPEKLFTILDLHDALSDLLPDIDTVFESKSSESIRMQAAEILYRLAEAARGMLSRFEHDVFTEEDSHFTVSGRILPPGGTLHPLTRYVMNYISLISDYKQTLKELIVSEPPARLYLPDPDIPDMDFSKYNYETLEFHLIWVTVTLQFKLNGKSTHYKDDALANLFMMNNVQYIVQEINRSPKLMEMIGAQYLTRLPGKVLLAANRYLQATWKCPLFFLEVEYLLVSGSDGLESALIERLKHFNEMFEEVHKTQATWSVPDGQLRERLRKSTLEKLIPTYRSFLETFRIVRHPRSTSSIQLRTLRMQ